MPIKKQLSPKEATSYKKILSLKRDNIESGEFQMSIGQTGVSIWYCETGKLEKHILSIPRKDFNKLLKFYTTKQSIKGS